MTDTLKFYCPSYAYPDSVSHILNEVSLTLRRGERLCISGESGTGKTTLLKLLALHMPLVTGAYQFFNGEQLHPLTEVLAQPYRLHHIAYMPQSSPMIPYLTALENALLPLRYKGISENDAMNTVFPLFEALDLQEACHQYPETLSGGQRQRTAFIRAIGVQPDLLLADEPSSALDAINIGRMQSILETFSESGGTTVIVSHDKTISDWCASSLICK